VIDVWHPEVKSEELRSAITATFPAIERVSGDKGEKNDNEEREGDSCGLLANATVVTQAITVNAVALDADEIEGSGAIIIGEEGESGETSNTKLSDGPMMAITATAATTSSDEVATAMMLANAEPIPTTSTAAMEDDNHGNSTHYTPVELGLQVGGEIYLANEFFLFRNQDVQSTAMGGSGPGAGAGTGVSDESTSRWSFQQRSQQQQQQPTGNIHYDTDRTLKQEYIQIQEKLHKMSLNAEPSRRGQQWHHMVKLLMVGDSGTGKNAFLMRLTESSNRFVPTFIHTIGIDFKIANRTVLNPLLYPALRLPVVAAGAVAASAATAAAAATATETTTTTAGAPNVASSSVPILVPASASYQRIYEIKCQIWDTASQERFRTITTAYYRGAQGIFLFYNVTDRQSFQNVRRWMQDIQKHAGDEVVIILIGTKDDIAIDQVKREKQRRQQQRQQGNADPVEVKLRQEDEVHEKASANVENGGEHGDDNEDELESDPNLDMCQATRTVSFEEGLALAQEYRLPAFLEVSSRFDCHVHDALSTMIGHILKQRLLAEGFVPPAASHVDGGVPAPTRRGQRSGRDCVVC
jgi:small GTP-binding protein